MTNSVVKPTYLNLSMSGKTQIISLLYGALYI